jgi:hypothetical protein
MLIWTGEVVLGQRRYGVSFRSGWFIGVTRTPFI